MPVMDGFQATTSIRNIEAEYGINPTLIIGLTGHVSDMYQEKSREVGMN